MNFRSHSSPRRASRTGKSGNASICPTARSVRTCIASSRSSGSAPGASSSAPLPPARARRTEHRAAAACRSENDVRHDVGTPSEYAGKSRRSTDAPPGGRPYPRRRLANQLARRSPMAGVRNVALVHGGFVDGSGWEGVYHVLKEEGFDVSVVQNPTLSLEDDDVVTRRVLDKQDGPTILVGHSYGGAVITEAGTHE